MSPRQPQEVRLVPVVAVRVALTVIGALLVLVVMDRSRTILSWLITAGAAAMLLDGPVRALAERGVRRGIAVLVVTLTTLTGTVLLTYGIVDAVVEQYGNLRTTAPEAVADVVRSGPLSDLDGRLDLVARTSDIVAQAPERLFGSPASAVRTAAERLGEVALVITLTVFMLVAYERFEQRLLQLQAAGSPARWAGIDLGVARGAGRARHVIGRAVLLGVVTAVVAQVADVPGPVVLGLWMAWWRMLPVVGLVVGHAPLVLLLVTQTSEVVTAVALLVLAAAEVLAQLAEAHASVTGTPHVPMAFVCALAFFAGFEMAGVTGAVVVVVLAHLLVGLLHEVGPETEPAPTAVRSGVP